MQLRKHKTWHNGLKIGEMLKSIIGEIWSITDSGLSCTIRRGSAKKIGGSSEINGTLNMVI